MSNDWAMYLLVFGAVCVVMARLDRLGKQLEAVSADIKIELSNDDDKRDEIMSEWKNARAQAAKDARQFWFFWGAIAAAVGAWKVLGT